MGLTESKEKKQHGSVASIPSMLVRGGALLRDSVTTLVRASSTTEYDENRIMSVLQEKMSERGESKMYKVRDPQALLWLEAASKSIQVGVLGDKYKLLSAIGKGGETEGVLAVLGKEDRKKYACKTMILSVDELDGCDDGVGEEDRTFFDSHRTVSLNTLVKEMSILTSTDHPNIIKAKECVIQGRKVYLIEELCTGGSLLDNYEESEYSHSEVLIIMEQVFDALAYLHERNIVHCDIKLENILLSEPGDIHEIKLIDFGMAEDTEMPSPKPDLTLIKGTLQYMAPEVLEGKDGALYPPCDVWSAGVLMYVLLVGSFPFEGETREELLESISGGLDESKLIGLERGLQYALKKLLSPDPQKRATSTEALTSSWIKSSSLSTIKLYDD